MTDSSSRFKAFLAAAASVRGAAVAIVLLALGLVAESAPQLWLRGQLFDGYQRLLPRPRTSAPATVVAIDERSLEEFGQWPWPRTRIAELLDRISAAQPAAVGIDILWPEPDRLSPRRILAQFAGSDPALARRAAALPDNDEILAQALRGRPIVLGIAGEPTASPAAEDRPVRIAPVLMRGEPAGLLQVPQFAGVVRSRPEMEAAAAGQGLINSPPEGVVRRVALLGRVGDLLLASLEMEMVRVAAGLPMIETQMDADGVRSVRIGDISIPTDHNGAVWLRYRQPDLVNYVSAADVLLGKADPEMLRQRFVLVAPTGLGLVDQPPIPLGQRIPGVEIRAQLLENVFEGRWLHRPDWATSVEAALFVALALIFVALLPDRTQGEALGLLGGAALVFGLGGLIVFNAGVLIDVASPSAAGLLVFMLVLGGTLAETQRQRRELTQRLAAERETAAHLAGELETARRVQMGMLPVAPGVLEGDARIELDAFMEPARTVGGDLYDFFMLDERRLFVMIGDVSGKGLAAAMFMALIKSLCRSAVLREPLALDRALAQAEAEIRRENPESLFVTLLVLTLDLDSGEVVYCNAGHDPVYGLRAGQPPRKLDHGGRPPLCVLEGYPYPLGHEQLAPGETLCMITDGITEAANRAGQLYGHQRLEGAMTRAAGGAPAEIVAAVRRDVEDFVAGAEQADDMSVVALRWRGL